VLFGSVFYVLGGFVNTNLEASGFVEAAVVPEW
jgi:hypothetical protein